MEKGYSVFRKDYSFELVPETNSERRRSKELGCQRRRFDSPIGSEVWTRRPWSFGFWKMGSLQPKVFHI